jgi:hypothetical protein
MQRDVHSERYILRNYASPGRVLALFSGTGTTAMAAMKEGFNVILIDNSTFQMTMSKERCERFFMFEKLKLKAKNIGVSKEDVAREAIVQMESAAAGKANTASQAQIDTIIQRIQITIIYRVAMKEYRIEEYLRKYLATLPASKVAELLAKSETELNKYFAAYDYTALMTHGHDEVVVEDDDMGGNSLPAPVVDGTDIHIATSSNIFPFNLFLSTQESNHL